MSSGQVKIKCKFILQYILDKLFGNRTSTNLTLLAWGTSENFKIFLPLLYVGLFGYCANTGHVVVFIKILQPKQSSTGPHLTLCFLITQDTSCSNNRTRYTIKIPILIICSHACMFCVLHVLCVTLLHVLHVYTSAMV